MSTTVQLYLMAREIRRAFPLDPASLATNQSEFMRAFSMMLNDKSGGWRIRWNESLLPDYPPSIQEDALLGYYRKSLYDRKELEHFELITETLNAVDEEWTESCVWKQIRNGIFHSNYLHLFDHVTNPHRSKWLFSGEKQVPWRWEMEITMNDTVPPVFPERYPVMEHSIFLTLNYESFNELHANYKRNEQMMMEHAHFRLEIEDLKQQNLRLNQSLESASNSDLDEK